MKGITPGSQGEPGTGVAGCADPLMTRLSDQNDLNVVHMPILTNVTSC